MIFLPKYQKKYIYDQFYINRAFLLIQTHTKLFHQNLRALYEIRKSRDNLPKCMFIDRLNDTCGKMKVQLTTRSK